MVLKTAKRLVIIIVGFTVVLIGIALIVLPGPAFLVIPAGLAILGTEFLWAKRLMNRIKRKTGAVLGKFEAVVFCPNCEADLVGKALKPGHVCPDCNAPISSDTADRANAEQARRTSKN